MCVIGLGLGLGWDDCNQRLLGFRFLSCRTDSHLAPVPNTVILKNKKNLKQKQGKGRKQEHTLCQLSVGERWHHKEMIICSCRNDSYCVSSHTDVGPLRSALWEEPLKRTKCADIMNHTLGWHGHCWQILWQSGCFWILTYLVWDRKVLGCDVSSSLITLI